MRLLRYGDRAVLIETEDVLGLRDSLLAQRHPAIEAVIPAARTVLVEYDPARFDPAGLLSQLRPVPSLGPAEAPLRIEVDYDGPDLAAVAEQAGLSPDEVVRRHSAAEYTVQFCGFSPGFGYLSGLPPELQLPRLATPRTRVPPGSVAVADEYTGVYPRPSPGGWRLLGRTDAVLFDLDRDPPALLQPGRRVRFCPR